LLVAITDGKIKKAGLLTIRVVPDDPYRIELSGELDLASTQAVETELRLGERSAAQRIVLDLDRLTFIDSTGLRLLVIATRRSDADGDRLRIRPGSDPLVQRVMAITGMNEYLRFEESNAPPLAFSPRLT
jgi:anti-anti-sigma factor